MPMAGHGLGALDATQLTLLLWDEESPNLIGIQAVVLPIDAVLKQPKPPLTDLRKPERVLPLRHLEFSKLVRSHLPEVDEVDDLTCNLKTDMSFPHGEHPVSKRHGGVLHTV
jgi:hypothetical protein